MKMNSLAIFCLIGGNLVGADLAPAPAYPPYVMPNTVCRVLPRTAPDRVYKLLINLPDSFAKHPERRYPVILVADGYWHFAMVAGLVANLNYGKHIPESIVVGLSYDDENLHYNNLRPVDLESGKSSGMFVEDDHSKRFLDMIETLALPLLERDYRADPKHRYLVGASGGADFALYAMLTKPELFQGYVADSPFPLGMWTMERTFAASGRTVDGRVSISSSENEWAEYRKWIPMFYERLKQDGIVKGGLT
jgi:predicted alpha/beta superfamily hydrolase